jgi:hypothetical protein
VIADNCQVAKTTARRLTTKSDAKSTISAKERRLIEQNRLIEQKLKKASKRSPTDFSRNRFGPLLLALAIGLSGMYFAVTALTFR